MMLSFSERNAHWTWPAFPSSLCNYEGVLVFDGGPFAVSRQKREGLRQQKSWACSPALDDVWGRLQDLHLRVALSLILQSRWLSDQTLAGQHISLVRWTTQMLKKCISETPHEKKSASDSSAIIMTVWSKRGRSVTVKKTSAFNMKSQLVSCLLPSVNFGLF